MLLNAVDTQIPRYKLTVESKEGDELALLHFMLLPPFPLICACGSGIVML